MLLNYIKNNIFIFVFRVALFIRTLHHYFTAFKKGRAQKGIGVEYNSTVTFDNVAVVPDYQYEYGQGDGGVKPTTLTAAQAT